jgi:hypothetical protein
MIGRRTTITHRVRHLPMSHLGRPAPPALGRGQRLLLASFLVPLGRERVCEWIRPTGFEFISTRARFIRVGMVIRLLIVLRTTASFPPAHSHPRPHIISSSIACESGADGKQKRKRHAGGSGVIGRPPARPFNPEEVLRIWGKKSAVTHAYPATPPHRLKALDACSASIAASRSSHKEEHQSMLSRLGSLK